MKGFVLKIGVLALPILLAVAAAKDKQQNTGALTPVPGNYPDTSLPLSTDTTDTPDAPPANTTSISVSTSTNFKGTLEASPVSGIVRITNAHPAGTYTVTVRAFDSGGASATKTFMLTVTTPATCMNVSFAPAVNIAPTRGTGPASVAVGDFNGDRNQDLAVVNRGLNNVSILLGDGAGNFSMPNNFPTGTQPVSLAVGDFNGDGAQDLAIANIFNSVSILLGDGAGHFSAPNNFAANDTPTSIAVGDFNGDGKQDIVVSNAGGPVSILLGDGAGHFSAPTAYPAANNPRQLVVGDFNGDGNKDVAMVWNGSFTGLVSIVLGDGAGHFSAATTYPVGNQSNSVAVGHFNGDGNQDLVVANRDSNNVSILLGDGTGHFSTATNFPAGTQPASVAVGDFNGDGNQDLAVANNIDAGHVSILSGDGAGHFSTPTDFGTVSDPFSIALGDFNGDGMQDLAVNTGIFPNNGNVSILLRNCTPTPISVASRKIHGSAGSFDLDLALTGSPAIECRSTGGTNDYTIIVTYPSAVTVDGNPQAGVTLGTGCVGSSGACTGSVSISGNTVMIPLTNVANLQTINVRLFRVNNSGDLFIPMSVLVGDVTASRVVNASDISQTKAHVGQPVDQTNFRSDVNTSGAINATDVSIIKQNSGTSLPP